MLSLIDTTGDRFFEWPVGSVIYSTGSTPPPGTLPLDGKYYSVEKYRLLFQVIGYVFGKDALGNFKLPSITDYVSVQNDYSTGINPLSTPFVKTPPKVLAHQHSSGYTSTVSDHYHSTGVTVVYSGGVGTNGLSTDATCTSASSAPGLSGSGDHYHWCSQTETNGVYNWRPTSMSVKAYIVCGV